MSRPKFIYFEIDAQDVRPGDLYANGAIVTAVIKAGDLPIDSAWSDMELPPGKVRVECGSGFSVTCDPDRQIVIGHWTGTLA